MEFDTLENGFKVVYEKPKNVIPIAAVYLFIRQGSVNETQDTRGGSHMIEHMCFKGTRKIPNSKDISIKFDEVGAYFNAYTSKHVTCYTIKCAESFLHNCLNILCDMVLNSRFSKPEFTKEENVVREETIKNETSESIRVFKSMDTLLYEGSALAYPIDDISYHIEDFDYNAIVDLYHNTYRLNNMVLSIVTHIPFRTVKNMLGGFRRPQKFELCDRIGTSMPMFSTIILSQDGIKYYINKSTVEKSVYLAVGFRTCNMFHEDIYPLELLSTILSGTMSGRLFILLREKNAVTYSSNADTNYYSYSGDFIIHTSSDYNKIMESSNIGIGHNVTKKNKKKKKKGVLPLIIGELKNLVKNGITTKELQTSKGYIRGKSIMDLENCDNQAQYNGEYAIMQTYNQESNKPFIRYSDIYDKCIDPLTCSDISRVIKKYFVKENMAVVLSGKNVPSLDKIKDICEKF